MKLKRLGILLTIQSFFIKVITIYSKEIWKIWVSNEQSNFYNVVGCFPGLKSSVDIPL